jgi:hypothetical protein
LILLGQTEDNLLVPGARSNQCVVMNDDRKLHKWGGNEGELVAKTRKTGTRWRHEKKGESKSARSGVWLGGWAFGCLGACLGVDGCVCVYECVRVRDHGWMTG